MKNIVRFASIATILLCGPACGCIQSMTNPAHPEVTEQEGQNDNKTGCVPFTARVNVQSETADPAAIIDGEWVAVGCKKDYALQLDYDNLYKGQHSYRFELRGEEDNTLSSHSGGSKGRSEMSWCYATDADFAGQDASVLEDATILKTVYYHGKGYCPQASSMRYRFAIKLPSSAPDNISSIFAQWHGMPSRTLARRPDGQIVNLSDSEFIELSKTMTIKKDRGYEVGTDGKLHENGWRFEQGGYPPLAFAFGSGYFYIQANSDRSWLTDKDIRCNINPTSAEIGDYRIAPNKGPVTDIKRSTLVYKMPIADFPKDTWVSFDILVNWTKYGQEAETAEGGMIDINMSWDQPTKARKARKEAYQETISMHIVDHMPLLIGRNDHKGYYFKFGIYRADGSTVPVIWNLAGYEETEL